MPSEDQARTGRSSMIGETLSHYEIHAMLGKGGMGVVYLGYDPRLDRQVAIKVLSEDFCLDQKHRQRFMTEARSASALNHPNIVTIYEIGNERGRDFIAMEFIEGRSLQEMMDPGEPLAPDRLLDLGIQLSSALSAAHRAGIVHRDLKPGNVMVTPEGRAKILDFGLAKRQSGGAAAAEPGSDEIAATVMLSQTVPGAILGTPGYMAPEKARGEEGDHRADIFSLGCILYALATGKAPFTGDTLVDVLHSVIHDQPVAVETVRRDLPGKLGTTVNRCLEKHARDRYASAEDIEGVLREIQTEQTGEAFLASSSVAAPPARRRPLILGIVTAALVLAAVGFQFLRTDDSAATTTVIVENEAGEKIQREIPVRELRRRVTVFPFTPVSGDSSDAWLAHAASSLLAQDLLQDYYISFDLLAEHQLAQTATPSGYPAGVGAPISLMRQVAKESNCSHFVTGRIAASGDSVRYDVQLYVTERGRIEAEFQEVGDDLFRTADAASRRLRRLLGVPERHLEEWPDLPVADIGTASPAALQAYCRSFEASYIRNDLSEARRHLEDAVREDPTYAWALWSLYISYLFAGEGNNPRIPEVLESLMTHIYRLPERLQFAVKSNYFEYHGDPEKQLAVLKMWGELYPDDALAHETLVQMYTVRGEHAEALAALHRLLELDPDSPDYLTRAARFHRDRGDWDAAKSYLDRIVAAAPDNSAALRELSQLLHLMGRHDEATSYLEKALALAPQDIGLLLALADAEFHSGRLDASLDVLRRAATIASNPDERLTVRMRLSSHHDARGRLEQARAILEEALAESEGRVAQIRRVFIRAHLAALYGVKGDRNAAKQQIEDLRASLSFPLTAIAPLMEMFVHLALEELDAARAAADEFKKAIDEMQWEHLRPSWLEGMGEILEAESAPDSALVHYRHWLDLEPTSDEALFHVARGLRKVGRFDEALSHIDRALAQTPYNAETLYEAALIAKAAGDEDRARAHLQRALEVWSPADPDHGDSQEARATWQEWQQGG